MPGSHSKEPLARATVYFYLEESFVFRRQSGFVELVWFVVNVRINTWNERVFESDTE